MRGTLVILALATAMLFCASGCFLPTSRSFEAPPIDFGHPYWMRDQIPDGISVGEAVGKLEEAGLTCEVDGSQLRCYSRQDPIFSSERPKSLYEFEIEDGKVFDRSISPQMKQYRTHGGII